MRRLALTLLLLLGAAAGACSGGDDAPSSAASTGDATTAAAEASTTSAGSSAAAATAVDADAAPVGALATVGEYLVAANLAEVARLAAAGASSFAMVPPGPGGAFAMSAVGAVGPSEQGATLLVLGYGDAASATAGAEVLRRLIAEGTSQVANRTWAELLGTPAPEIAVEDATVVARFAAPAARRILFRAFSARDFIWAAPAPG